MTTQTLALAASLLLSVASSDAAAGPAGSGVAACRIMADGSTRCLGVKPGGTPYRSPVAGPGSLPDAVDARRPVAGSSEFRSPFAQLTRPTGRFQAISERDWRAEAEQREEETAQQEEETGQHGSASTQGAVCAAGPDDWMERAEEWAEAVVVFGAEELDQDEAMDILAAPSHKNGAMELAAQLVATELSLDQGMDAGPLGRSLAEAHELVVELQEAGVDVATMDQCEAEICAESSARGHELAEQLADFNLGACE